MECIFCKIAVGEMPANIVYEDENIIAFDDIFPKAPIHKLIIPRKHIATLNDINDEDRELTGNMMLVAQKIAKDLHISEDGYRVLMNCNKHGGQEVYHIHLHLLGGKQLPTFG